MGYGWTRKISYCDTSYYKGTCGVIVVFDLTLIRKVLTENWFKEINVL